MTLYRIVWQWNGGHKFIGPEKFTSKDEASRFLKDKLSVTDATILTFEEIVSEVEE